MKIKKLNRQECWLFVALLIFLIIVLCFGRVEFHNELEKEIYSKVFIGYLDNKNYTNEVTVTSDSLPGWCQKMKRDSLLKVSFPNGVSGRIGIFADLVYYENRFERRTWFSGKLLNRDVEYYYKQEGALCLLPVDDMEIVCVDLQQIKPQTYDYTTFRGNDTKKSIL